MKTWILALAGPALGLLALPAAHAQYVGFGSVTRGAEGCASFETYHVTSLGDAGAGTLRDAVSRDCRNVVFDAAGTIALTSKLLVNRSFLTIDGSTAPQPGITIDARGIRLAIEASASVGPAHDIIIRHLRVEGSRTEIESVDIWELDGQAAAVYNVIIDHVTAVSSSDGSFDVWGEVHDVTLSNNLIRDTRKGHHFSMATPPNRERITIFGNVYARNNERQVRMRYDNRNVDIVNNVIYGWGWFESGAAGLHLPSDAGFAPSINVENNVYHYVSAAPNGGPDDAILFEASTFPGSIYFSGNVVPAGENDAVSTSGRIPVPAYAEVPKRPASELGDAIVPCAGMLFPNQAELDLLAEISAAIGGTGAPCKRPKPPTSLTVQ